MSRSALLVAGLGASLFGGMVPQPVRQAQTSKPSAISLALTTPHLNVKPGDRVILKKTVVNRSDHEITLLINASHPPCAEVRDASGSFAADRKLGYLNGRPDFDLLARMTPEQAIESGLLTGKLAWVQLKPGEVFTTACDATDFFDMTKLGVYKVTVDFADPDSAVLIKSNAIEVTVAR